MSSSSTLSPSEKATPSSTVQLDLRQQELLAEILNSVLSDLSYEIADTDSSVFKATLKERRDAITAIRNKLPD